MNNNCHEAHDMQNKYHLPVGHKNRGRFAEFHRRFYRTACGAYRYHI